MIRAGKPFRFVAPLLLLPSGAFATAALAAFAAQAGTRAIVAVALVFCLLIAAVLARSLLAVLVFALCFVMSYNRQFYSFDSWLGDYGSFGLFWTLADAMMIAIMGAALARRAVAGRTLPTVRRNLSIEIPMLLLVAAMMLSALRTDPLPPALFETLRIGKYLLYFVVLHALMDRDLVRVALVGVGAMMAVQFALGAVQVALAAGGSGLGSFEEQAGEMARRATGTTGHPNMYAPFLLMPAVGFIALGASGRRLLVHRLPLVIGCAGAAAIVLSQSRAPVAALLLALGFVTVAFMVRRIQPAPKVVGVTVICAMLGLLALAPLTSQIIDRLTGDLHGSVDFRADYNDAAIGIWGLSPILGVGPARFVPNLPAFHPDYAGINADIQPARKAANVRAIAPVHNVYLWILAELGILGLSAFLVFLGAAAFLFHQAARGTEPANRFFIGVFWGFVGLCALQLMDFSLWWDHQLMILTLLLAVAAFVRDQGRAK